MSCRYRRLSDPEWAFFNQDVNVLTLGLPPWGGVVRWGDMDVLVFVGASGEVFTTDVTGCPIVQTLQNYGTYNPFQNYSVAHLLPELWETTKADIAYAYQTAPAALRDAAIAAMDAIGRAAAAGLNPALGGAMTPILIGAIVILGLMYLPKPRSRAA